MFPISSLYATQNLVSSRNMGSAVPSRISLVTLHTMAESGSFSRALLLHPAFSEGVRLLSYRLPQSGQPRVYQVTQLRTVSVHRQELAGTGPVVLRIVRATGAACSGNAMDQYLRAHIFPDPLLVLLWTIVEAMRNSNNYILHRNTHRNTTVEVWYGINTFFFFFLIYGVLVRIRSI